LVLEVGLESADSLGVISLKSVDDGRDLLGSLWRVFSVHGGGILRRGRYEGDVGGRFAMVGQSEDFDVV